MFPELLIESSEIWNVIISASCLLPAHYHILLQTPEANLSMFMRHINGIYTQRFNSVMDPGSANLSISVNTPYLIPFVSQIVLP